MQQSFNDLTFILGDEAQLRAMPERATYPAFAPEILALLHTFSRLTLQDAEAKAWPDVVSLGFWCREASLAQMQAAYGDLPNRYGRGVVFHIAPGNVAANFAYSLLTGLLTGNANIVRLPGRDHPQVAIIVRLLAAALMQHPALAPYICLLRYERQQSINDALSALCDTRIIWGGDETIAQIRRSPLKPRAREIAFADRYSIAAIDADRYLAHADKEKLARAFFNDTLLNDQNACSSPSLVVWLGKETQAARELFWQHFHAFAARFYHLEPVAAVNKLTRLCLLGATWPGVKKVSADDNLLVRIELPEVNSAVMELRGNCGFFLEYVAESLDEIVPVCGERCQTLATFGIENATVTAWLATRRPQGIDRVVPFGRTLDFTLQWDGYDLVAMLTRTVAIG
ncbi:acyl-CoA reductase [Kosakonia oryzendophytica]|uniref:acyl-CoA reductase n=1 Tax=Kosakonia oryzendophytica TaxID=1005665 RepID=UPI003D33040D